MRPVAAPHTALGVRFEQRAHHAEPFLERDKFFD
jgi:hypothetical protein